MVQMINNKTRALATTLLLALAVVALVAQEPQRFERGIEVIRGPITTNGAITTANPSAGPQGGIGYRTGAGCTVTQATNRTTGVTCNGNSGAITTNNASLAAEAGATFVVTNAAVAIGDTIILSQRSGSNGGMTQVEVVAVAAGSFSIEVLNNNVAAGTAETGAIIINFAVIKAVSS